MQSNVTSHRIARLTTVALGLVVFGAGGAGAATALGRSTGEAAASRVPSPAHTITAHTITPVPKTLPPGTPVEAGELGHRTFVDAVHGFALASIGEAQYPAATADSGKTWALSGPALHLDAAQAPLGVCEVGAADQRVYYAYGCGEVVDTTNDGGKHWWRADLGGGSLGVVNSGGRLLAFVEALSESGSTAATWVYVSSDGGRHWHYENRL